MTSATPADPAGGGAFPTYPGADGQSYAYPGAAPGPWAAYTAPTTLAVEPRPSGKAKGLTALAVAAVIAVLGLPLGWIWSSFAPWLPGVIQSDGLFLQQPYGEQRAGQETWFILLSIGAGVLCRDHRLGRAAPLPRPAHGGRARRRRHRGRLDRLAVRP